MFTNLHFYIDLNWESFIESKTYPKQLYNLVSIAYLHKANVYYSKKQIAQLKEGFEFFKDLIPELNEGFSQSLGNLLDLILKDALPKDEKNIIFQICLAKSDTHLKLLKNNAFSIIDPIPNTALLSITEPPAIVMLLSIKTGSSLDIIEVNPFNNPSEVIKWISKINIRIFNLSPKHGENGVGNWQGESCLLCNKSEAQNYLYKAIPDLNIKKKRLFYFDEEKDTFIEFFYEGNNPQKQWHGFHLKKEEWEQRVPDSVRKFFLTPK